MHFFRLSVVAFFIFSIVACGNAKKQHIIRAELLCEPSQAGANEKEQERLNRAEVNRVKALLLNDRILQESIRKSKLDLTLPAVKENLRLEAVEQTTIIGIEFTAVNYRAAVAFIDTLCDLVQRYDVLPEQEALSKQIEQINLRTKTIEERIRPIEKNQDSAKPLAECEDAYVELLQKRAEYSIRKAGIFSRIRIISKARVEEEQ